MNIVTMLTHSALAHINSYISYQHIYFTFN
ncbi:hypothetical protein F383_12562 [Gossypium arboreum]|uniref:Uncharacterized protein n=1 Tax=Gossypium arboreum TaxID=29729 RepID=A0A0B0Q0D3_GOSAR|nr:hypothetical protein F383_12562 [Gossypium arboreum]